MASKRLRGESSSSRRPVSDHSSESASDGERSTRGMYVPTSPQYPELSRPLPRLPLIDDERVGYARGGAYSPNDWDRFRFIHASAHEQEESDRYLGWTKVGCPERRFPLPADDGFIHSRLHQLEQEENFASWYRIVQKSSSSIAREFYLNLRQNVVTLRRQDERYVYLRRTFVAFTPELIADILGFVPLGQTECAYHDFVRGPDALRHVSRFVFGADADHWERRDTLPEWKVDKFRVQDPAR